VFSQNMVMSFRVSDLQMLLGFVGRSKSGLKHELVTRALQLVQFDCSPELFKKIKELYETRYAKKSSEPVPQPHRPLDPLTMHSTYDRAGTVPRTPLSGPNIDYPVLYGKYLNGLGRLPAKTLKPEVRLVKLPFFNMLDELLKPTELVLRSSVCSLSLTPGTQTLELQPGIKAVQVVLRVGALPACPPPRPAPPGGSYSVALYLVRQLTSSELLQRLKTIGVKHPELCKALGELVGGARPSIRASPRGAQRQAGPLGRWLVAAGSPVLGLTCGRLAAPSFVSVGSGGGRRPCSKPDNGKPGADVVDLTLDSSSSSEEEEDEDEDEDEDEEGPRPKRRCPFQKGLVSAC
uniref:Protein inhibitor of activated STAT 4 n=1 Tax=Panthera tigris altaica TaxID=74533 RepID=A0A8C9JTT9_PANTA